MFVDVSGRRARVSSAGASLSADRPLIMFVHGAGMDRTAWAMVTRAFAHRGYSVVVPDLPGHGGSDGPPLESVENYAEWLVQLIDATGLAPAHLVGHSMGAAVALQAAATNPDAVRSLVLIGTGATMPVHPDLQLAADAGDPKAVDLIMDWGLSSAGQIQRHAIPGMALRDGGRRLMLNHLEGTLASDLRASAAYSGAVVAAKNVRCPTTLVLGERDRMTPPASAQPLDEALPADHETIVIQGSGHMIMLERPHDVIAAVRRHLERE